MPDLPQRRAAAVRLAALAVTAVAGASTAWFSPAPIVVLVVVAAAAVAVATSAPRLRLLPLVGVAVAAAVAVQLPTRDLDRITPAVLAGLLVALVVAVPLGVRRVVEQRRAYLRRGWQLAAAETRRRDDATALARQRERMTIAAEMHDGLGHSLTLVAVRLGQLSLSPTLTDDDRRQVREVRRLTSDAADDLGAAVRLLRRPGDLGAGWNPPELTAAVESARAAGVVVRFDPDPEVAGALGSDVAAAVGRIVQESLTNAAKHAPGRPVDVDVRLDGDRVRARITNPLPAPTDPPAPGSGVGLDGLRHRAEVLGGEVTANRSATEFVVEAILPATARPMTEPVPDVELRAAETEAADQRSRATRLAVGVPAAILGVAAFVVVAHFTLSTVLSVMSAADLAAIGVGQTRAEVERRLPPMQILDPPRDDFPARTGEECRYYESKISFFDRTDVLVVCFADDRVSRTGTVPAR